MSEQTNAELIATAKAMREQMGETPKPGSILALWFETADALEAAENRATELAAVVGKVRDYLEEGKGAYAPDLLDILATAPADALREHDAKVRAEALREAHADFQTYTDAGAPLGHRPIEEFLLRRADRIEKEAGL